MDRAHRICQDHSCAKSGVNLTLRRLYHGIADDRVPVGPCRDYVARLKKAGANVDLVEYPGATHAFDYQTIPGTLPLPQAQTWRKCRLEEKPQQVAEISGMNAPSILAVALK